MMKRVSDDEKSKWFPARSLFKNEMEEKGEDKSVVNLPAAGIDLEYESDVLILTPEAANYETVYVTSHKDPCKTTAYSYDGQFAATGSVDASIKLLDVDKMLIKG